MRRTLGWSLAACLLATPVFAPSAAADTRKAFCHLNVKTPVLKKTDNSAKCQFSQFQGNAYVVMYPATRSPLEFQFPEAQQGLIYQRANYEEGVKFTTPFLTLKVFWADPGTNRKF